jgi:hypothetical protein
MEKKKTNTPLRIKIVLLAVLWITGAALLYDYLT